jgi:hypothetical protein
MFWKFEKISDKNWIKTSKDSGTNNSQVTLNINLSHADTLKKGYIVVIAPDAENAIDTVWLVYNRSRTNNSQIKHEDPFFVKIYPNPVNQELSIESPDVFNGIYKIFSIDGRLLNSGSLEKSAKISVDTLTSGVYYITIGNDNLGYVKRKFIKY